MRVMQISIVIVCKWHSTTIKKIISKWILTQGLCKSILSFSEILLLQNAVIDDYLWANCRYAWWSWCAHWLVLTPPFGNAPFDDDDWVIRDDQSLKGSEEALASMQWLCGHYDLNQPQSMSSVARIGKIVQKRWTKPKSTTGPRSRRAWKPMAIKKVGFIYVLAPLLMASQTLCRMFHNWSRRHLLNPEEGWSHCALLGFSDKPCWRYSSVLIVSMVSNQEAFCITL